MGEYCAASNGRESTLLLSSADPVRRSRIDAETVIRIRRASQAIAERDQAPGIVPARSPRGCRAYVRALRNRRAFCGRPDSLAAATCLRPCPASPTRSRSLRRAAAGTWTPRTRARPAHPASSSQARSWRRRPGTARFLVDTASSARFPAVRASNSPPPSRSSAPDRVPLCTRGRGACSSTAIATSPR
jgi:hypothetical protein